MTFGSYIRFLLFCRKWNNVNPRSNQSGTWEKESTPLVLQTARSLSSQCRQCFNHLLAIGLLLILSCHVSELSIITLLSHYQASKDLPLYWIQKDDLQKHPQSLKRGCDLIRNSVSRMRQQFAVALKRLIVGQTSVPKAEKVSNPRTLVADVHLFHCPNTLDVFAGTARDKHHIPCHLATVGLVGLTVAAVCLVHQTRAQPYLWISASSCSSP